MTIHRLLAAAAAISLTASVAWAQAPATKLVANGDIMTTLRTATGFTTFVKALDATNLASLLQKQPGITVFAPTDSAFAALPPGELDKMMADKPGLQKLLVYHLINAKIDSTKIKGARGPVPAGSGDKIVLDGTTEGVLKAENATITQSDVQASNGLIQVVDQVMKPNSVPEVVAQPEPEAAPAPPPAPEPAPKAPAKKKK